MSLIKENTIPPKFMEHLIFGALFVLALGLLTSTSILALSHILMLVPCVYFAFHTNWKEIPKSAWALLGLSIAIILSVVVNQEIMVKGWKPLFKVKYFLFGFFSIVPFHWWIKNKMTEKQLKVLLYTFLIATTVSVVIGFISMSMGINLLTKKTLLHPERNSGTFGMVMNFAHNLSLFLIIPIGLVIRKKASKLFVVLTTICFVGFFFTFTRGAWLALIAAIPFYYFKAHKKAFYLVACLVVGAGILGYFIAGNKVIRPDSDNERLSQWYAASYAFKERPVIGWGYLNFEEHSKEIKLKYDIGEKDFQGHAHSNFFEIAAATGVIGMTFYVLWILFWIKENLIQQSLMSDIQLVFIIAFLVGGLTQSTISLGINLFFIMNVFALSHYRNSEEVKTKKG